MRRWVVVPAAIAPVALIGGWTWAATLQPSGYEARRDTISALAAHGARDRWVMTAGLAVLGLCHVASAIGLSGVFTAARALLATGGAATVAVAALPQPDTGHVPAAAIGFLTLAAWPALARSPNRRSAFAGSAVLFALLGWLAIELDGGRLLGLSERLLAGGEALWPLIVVLAYRTVATPTRASAGDVPRR